MNKNRTYNGGAELISTKTSGSYSDKQDLIATGGKPLARIKNHSGKVEVVHTSDLKADPK